MGEIKTIDCKVERLTNGPKHHLFGFHDLLISNKTDTKYLCLEVDTINRPPLPDEKFSVGYVENGLFIKVGETTALNYPQGARQQWVGDTNLFTVNNRVDDNWAADLYDADNNKLVEHLPATVHMLTKDGRYALGLDYARLHRLGGYGYTGLEDKSANDPFPADSGITIMDMKTKDVKLLVSVKQVAECGVSNLSGQTHHYLTHLCLNPSCSRVAFLHRYFMPDGGLMTRLMTVGLDGKDLRCLGQGFLSHYDWKDDNHIYIFGRVGSPVDAIRNNPLMSNSVVKFSLRLAKKMIKSVIGKGKGIVGGMSFLMIEDTPVATTTAFAKEIIPTDGHPMTNPVNRNWCICDNYPDNDGYRDLFLYNFEQNQRINLGRFRRIFENPDMKFKDLYLKDLYKDNQHAFSEETISFYKSGLHCDLHPRWNTNGKWAVFDSIHEGTRQVYRINISAIIFSYTV